MNRRDDFSKKTKETLFKRVSGACSNPSCLVPTSGPNSNPEKSVNIGVAAHIHAASANGPRYLEAMDRQERVSIDNAIWLCQNCAKLIDSDDNQFSSDLIRHWKQLAEARAQAQLGEKPLPTKLNELGTLGTTIKSIIRERELSLNGLDPRLRVSASFDSGTERYEIQALETFSFEGSFKLPDEDAIGRFKRHVEHGETFEADVKDFELTGSPLFDELLKGPKSGTVVIEKEKRPVNVRLVRTSSGELLHSEQTLLSAGKKFVSLVQPTASPLSISLSINMNDIGASHFAIGFDYTQWFEADISRLPFFEAARSVLTNLSDLTVELHVNGHRMMQAAIANIDAEDAKQTRQLFERLSLLREIAKISGASWEYGKIIDEIDNESWLITAIHRLLSKDSTPFVFSHGTFTFEISAATSAMIVKNGRGAGPFRFSCKQWSPELFGQPFSFKDPVFEVRNYLVERNGKRVNQLTLKKGKREKLAVYGDESSDIRIFLTTDS